MKITIIGWYGTETIGDRAIFAGLLSIFKKAFGNFEISLGSIYPYYSQRMINEDHRFWKEILGNDLKISIFDSKQSKELDAVIIASDLLVIGGGPLMHISQMYMLEYAFKKAKKLNKKTVILGCGIGPIFTKQYKKSLLNIIAFSDVVILRDESSRNNLLEISKEFNKKLDETSISVNFDPAVIAALEFNKYYSTEVNDYIAVNLRSFPGEYAITNNSSSINNVLQQFIESLSNQFDKKIKMIPMHYFHIGDDDREFLNSIKFSIKNKNIIVQNEPLSLVETMKIYKNASFCVGMRFHSVVLQTIVNGNNYVLDYTEPGKGKIHGFLSDVDKVGFYKDRYFGLQQDSEDLSFRFTNEKFTVDQTSIDTLTMYESLLLKLMS